MHPLPFSSTCHGVVKCQQRVWLDCASVHQSVRAICNRGQANKRQKRACGPVPVTRALELDIDLPDIDLDLGSVQDEQGALIEVSTCPELEVPRW